MEKYKQAILFYGFKVILFILRDLEEKENYEECNLIELAFKELEKELPFKYPRSVDVITNYIPDLYRYGLSGKVRWDNLFEYYEIAKKDLEIIV